MEDKLYDEYLEWYNKKFGAYPNQRFNNIKSIDEMLHLRREYRDEHPTSTLRFLLSSKEIEEGLKFLKVITFEEFKEFYPIMNYIKQLEYEKN